MLKNILSLFFTFMLIATFSQVEPSVKEREETANAMFEVGEFEVAKEIFQKLLEEGESNGNIYYRLGLCEMELKDPADALPYLEKALELGFNESISNSLKQDHYNNNYYSFDLNFAIARSYHLEYQFEKAIEQYSIYLNKSGISQSEKIITALYLSQAKKGMELLAKQTNNVKIQNMGNRINSKYDEYGALVYKDTSTIIFTRKQPNRHTKSIDIDGSFKEDIFITHKRKDGKWSESFRIGSSINNDKKNDFAAALHSNDQNLIVSYENGKLYEFQKKGGQWVNSDKIDEKIVARAITVTPKVIIISSSYYGSVGGLDLFISSKDSSGEWSDFTPLQAVNTIYNECYPFLDPYDNTLYFSSNSSESTGGYDVFKSLYNPLTNTWDKPINLGYPINTPREDIYFTYHSTTNVAFYNSYRKDGFGGLDIYMVDYNFKNTGNCNLALKLITEDSLSKPIKCEFKIIDIASKESFVFSSDEEGNAMIPVLGSKSYQFLIRDINYDFVDTTIAIPTNATEFAITLRLSPLEEGKKYTLANVQFDRDEAKLKIAAYHELDKFYQLLLEHPDLAIEIAGHTELGGLASQNKVLSQLRSNAVKDYLIKKGIDSKRIMSSGYGSKYPISKENTEEAKSLNRRTEIILHHVDEKADHWEAFYK